MAKLYFYYGPMGSAKTVRLLVDAYNLEERGISFCCLKPSVDTRSNLISSRINGLERSATAFSSHDNLFAILSFIINNDNKRYNTIFVDEAQFLSEKQVDDLSMIVDLFDINVKCYGLRTNFLTRLFEGSKRLFEIADELIELSNVCECGNKTLFNVRVIDDTVAIEGDEILIGGDDMYTTMCRKCYHHIVS